MEEVRCYRKIIRQWVPALLPLTIALACYVAFRSRRTVVNEIIVSCGGMTFYTDLTSVLSNWLAPLSPYSGWLPSFLWVLALALSARGWWLRVFHVSLPLAVTPALLNAGWECVQALHWSDGAANMGDVVAGFAASAVIMIWDAARQRRPKVLHRLRWRHSLIAFSAWAIIYLADVRIS